MLKRSVTEAWWTRLAMILATCVIYESSVANNGPHNAPHPAAGRGTYWLTRPLLPDPGLTNAKIQIVRSNDSGRELSHVDLSFVGRSIAGRAQGSGKYVLANRMELTTHGRNQLRMLLVIDDNRQIARRFVLPRSGDAIYRQHQGKWIEQHVEASSSKISLEFSSPDGQGISLGLQGPCCSSMSQSFGPYK